jgi:hypothetical protein
MSSATEEVDQVPDDPAGAASTPILIGAIGSPIDKYYLPPERVASGSGRSRSADRDRLRVLGGG